MSDFNEDRAHEAGRPGIQPDEDDLIGAAEFGQILRGERLMNRLTEEEIVNRAMAKQPTTMIGRRKYKVFHLINPERKTDFDECQPRRLLTQFEVDLVARQREDEKARRLHLLWFGIPLTGLAVYLFGKLLWW
jgi:hypothetical protein